MGVVTNNLFIGTPVTSNGLLDPYLKLRRAEKHLDALDELLKPFTGEKAYTITFYDDLEQGRYCMKCELHDIPEEICLTVGDAFYNMRSCLDQLVWSLARRGRPPVEHDRTQFPVMEVNNSGSRKRFREQTDGVSESARGEILSLQPYHRGDTYKKHPLWRLDAMCNLDKHRRIPANGSEGLFQFPLITQGDVVGVKPFFGGLIVERPADFRVDAFHNCHIVSVPLADKGKLKLNPSVPFKVNFGQGFGPDDAGGFIEDRQTIGEIYEFVRDSVLPRFVRFFP
jgi:hypothetical protein